MAELGGQEPHGAVQAQLREAVHGDPARDVTAESARRVEVPDVHQLVEDVVEEAVRSDVDWRAWSALLGHHQLARKRHPEQAGHPIRRHTAARTSATVYRDASTRKHPASVRLPHVA